MKSYLLNYKLIYYPSFNTYLDDYNKNILKKCNYFALLYWII